MDAFAQLDKVWFDSDRGVESDVSLVHRGPASLAIGSDYWIKRW